MRTNIGKTKWFAAAFALAVLGAALPAIPAAAAGPSPRRFLLLIDLRQNDLPGVEKSKNAALYFLGSTVGPEDEVAFVTYTELRGLQVREEFTTDRDRVRKSVEGLKEMIGPTEEDAWSTPLVTHNFLEEMGEFAKGLEGVEGTKNILYFTSGLPAYAYQNDRTFRELFDQMASRFKDARAPVFVVNALGHRADWQAIEEKNDFVLRKLAGISGGRYFYDVAQYKTIADEIGKLAVVPIP
jgi:hypothetical protein